ncbi:hypothetical protein BDR03DRAFT_1018268 [Suillus americanus]|nr:hypothetical protein BDR03DRAFT_1018268 [Suillus americanus]
MPPRQNAPSRRRVVRDVPIVRQAGLNIAGCSLADQLGCASETPESMGTPALPPRINHPPIFSHDRYSSMPPNHPGDVPLPRQLHFTGTVPHASGPDRVHHYLEPSRFRMVYTYAPLCGAEKSRQEYTDSVVYRDVTTGIQKTSARKFRLPPLRPPRELTMDSELTPTTTSGIITPRALASSQTVCEQATTVPVINKTDSKVIIKDAKGYVIAETLSYTIFQTTSNGIPTPSGCSSGPP